MGRLSAWLITTHGDGAWMIADAPSIARAIETLDDYRAPGPDRPAESIRYWERPTSDFITVVVQVTGVVEIGGPPPGGWQRYALGLIHPGIEYLDRTHGQDPVECVVCGSLSFDGNYWSLVYGPSGDETIYWANSPWRCGRCLFIRRGGTAETDMLNPADPVWQQGDHPGST